MGSREDLVIRPMLIPPKTRMNIRRPGIGAHWCSALRDNNSSQISALQKSARTQARVKRHQGIFPLRRVWRTPCSGTRGRQRKSPPDHSGGDSSTQHIFSRSAFIGLHLPPRCRLDSRARARIVHKRERLNHPAGRLHPVDRQVPGFPAHPGAPHQSADHPAGCSFRRGSNQGGGIALPGVHPAGPGTCPSL